MLFDAAHYTQGDAFQIEKRMVFAREWLPLAVQEQLARPGQYVAAAPGGWPMLAVCGADGVARAFRNICRHQNMLLVGQDAGACENFRCRFHGWTYDLSGALFDAPPAVAPGGERGLHALMPIALQPWRQVVLVNLQADAPAPEWTAPGTAFDAHAAACGHYAGARMIDIACNWKTLLESVLPDADVAWYWPTLMLRVGGGVMLLDQIVPRTFLRTRVIRHAYVATADGTDAVVQAALAALDVLKSQAETLHSARARGCRGYVACARRRIARAARGRVRAGRGAYVTPT